MPSFVVRDVHPELWYAAREQARRTGEDFTVLLERLLREWLQREAANK